MFQTIVKIFLLVIITAAITPFIRKLAFVLGAVDNPNARRINKKPMPTIGGLAIFVAFNIGEFVLLRKDFPTHELFSVLLASSVIILTGLIDDILELKPRQKMFGIFVASLVVYFLAGIKVRELSLPFLGHIQLGWWSFPLTIFWILALTNAVNLIDGLDGLATGVTLISLVTMGIVGFFFLKSWQHYVPIMCIMLAACLLGFLPYNFHPAKIFLGDTGALYIGFMISVLSLKGLKNKKNISQADKHHLHHQLMRMGLSHRQTVLAIYGISLIFSFVSLLSLVSPRWGIWLLILGLLFAVELFVETIGLLGEKYKPLLHFLQHTINKMERADPEVKVRRLNKRNTNKKDLR